MDCAFCHEEGESVQLHVIRGSNIVQCRRCGLIYTNPRMNWDYASSSDDFERELEVYRRHYWPKRKVSAERFWDGAEDYRKTGYLLDVGCGFGFFLNEAREHGWSVVGVEIAEDEAKWGEKHFGLPVVSTLDSDRLPKQEFDIITLWDSVEHIRDLKTLLEKCLQLLRPKGLLFLKTPNAQALTLDVSWWSWMYIFLYRHLVYPANPKEHVYHFTPEIIGHILGKSGFAVKLIETDQGWKERVIVGRNILVQLMRYPLMWIALLASLPYEMSIWAEKG